MSKTMSVCDGVHLFAISATCHVAVNDVCDTAIVSFCATSTTLLTHSFLFLVDRLAQGQTRQSTPSVFCCQCRSSTSLFCGFLSGIYCILVTVQKEQINNHRGVKKRTSARNDELSPQERAIQEVEELKSVQERQTDELSRRKLRESQSTIKDLTPPNQ